MRDSEKVIGTAFLIATLLKAFVITIWFGFFGHMYENEPSLIASFLLMFVWFFISAVLGWIIKKILIPIFGQELIPLLAYVIVGYFMFKSLYGGVRGNGILAEVLLFAGYFLIFRYGAYA